MQKFVAVLLGLTMIIIAGIVVNQKYAINFMSNGALRGSVGTPTTHCCQAGVCTLYTTGMVCGATFNNDPTCGGTCPPNDNTPNCCVGSSCVTIVPLSTSCDSPAPYTGNSDTCNNQCCRALGMGCHTFTDGSPFCCSGRVCDDRSGGSFICKVACGTGNSNTCESGSTCPTGKTPSTTQACADDTKICCTPTTPPPPPTCTTCQPTLTCLPPNQIPGTCPAGSVCCVPPATTCTNIDVMPRPKVCQTSGWANNYALNTTQISTLDSTNTANAQSFCNSQTVPDCAVGCNTTNVLKEFISGVTTYNPSNGTFPAPYGGAAPLCASIGPDYNPPTVTPKKAGRYTGGNCKLTATCTPVGTLPPPPPPPPPCGTVAGPACNGSCIAPMTCRPYPTATSPGCICMTPP